jgi:hypothetical protein
MGSFKSPKRSYDPLDLEMLEWVFDSAWTTLQVHFPLRDPDKDEELKTALRRKLFALACVDMYDPDTLRSRLAAGMAPPPLAVLTQIRS